MESEMQFEEKMKYIHQLIEKLKLVGSEDNIDIVIEKLRKSLDIDDIA